MDWYAEVAAEFTRLGKTADAGVVEEMAQHAAATFAAAQADGLTAAEAAAHARALVASWCAGTTGSHRLERAGAEALGGSADGRDWFGSGISAFLQDVRFGARMLARSPGLSAVVLLTIAFGAGLNGAVFMQFNAAFLRPPDLANPDTLVWLEDDATRSGGITYPDYADYRDRLQAIDLALSTGAAEKATMVGGVETRPADIALVSGNYFRVLQAPAALGRTFGPADDRPPLGTAIAVLSDAYWARQFGRARDILGRTVALNSKPFTVVGVMPAGFAGVRQPGGSAPDIWVPVWCHPLLEPGTDFLQRRTMWWGLQPIGRLRDGAPLAQARAQIASVAAQLDAEYPGQRSPRAPWIWRTSDFDPRVLRGEEAALLGFAGAATALVMLIACGNVAGLLLARTAARQQEIAIRLSLGASRVRITRQFLAEGLTLSVGGAVLGLIVAAWLRGLVAHDGAAAMAIDGRVLGYAVFLAVIATLTTALWPAVQASRTAPHPDAARSHSLRIGRLRTSMVVIEVAISLVLLLATALLLRGVVRAGSVDPGMPIDQLLAISTDADRHGYEGPRLDAMVREARRHLDGLPGVRATAVASPAPFSGSRAQTSVRRADQPAGAGVAAFTAAVSPDLLDVVDLQVVRGRWLTGGEDEVVINESLAVRLWPQGDRIGTRLTTGDFNRRSHVVVGVVRDAPYAELRHQHEPFLYQPSRTGTILVRTSAPATTVARSVTAAMKALDDRLTVETTLPAERVEDDRAAGRRLIVGAAGIGGLALLIALAGVAAIASHSVALRTREIGIRMALGARRADAVVLILRRALTPVAIGAVAGLAIASLGSRVLVSQLYGVSPLDPAAFIATAVFLLSAAALAAWLPARRAARVDPVTVLRNE